MTAEGLIGSVQEASMDGLQAWVSYNTPYAVRLHEAAVLAMDIRIQLLVASPPGEDA